MSDNGQPRKKARFQTNPVLIWHLTRARGAPWELLSINRPALVMLDLVA
jgi:hypothetical protein